jgi:hypothetical protein
MMFLQTHVAPSVLLFTSSVLALNFLSNECVTKNTCHNEHFWELSVPSSLSRAHKKDFNLETQHVLLCKPVTSQAVVVYVGTVYE